MVEATAQSPFTSLAARWSAAVVPDPSLEEATCDVLASITPDDLAEIEPVVAMLLQRLEGGPSGPGARRALIQLLDGVRRRGFSEALEPSQIDPWLKLLLPLIRLTGFTAGELLRSRDFLEGAAAFLQKRDPEFTGE
jgi:hypothetical protein